MLNFILFKTFKMLCDEYFYENYFFNYLKYQTHKPTTTTA